MEEPWRAERSDPTPPQEPAVVRRTDPEQVTPQDLGISIRERRTEGGPHDGLVPVDNAQTVTESSPGVHEVVPGESQVGSASDRIAQRVTDNGNPLAPPQPDQDAVRSGPGALGEDGSRPEHPLRSWLSTTVSLTALAGTLGALVYVAMYTVTVAFYQWFGLTPRQAGYTQLDVLSAPR